MKIIECPRDAMQGMHKFIATQDKISYINQLLQVGFDTIDFGSFVSPKAIPQMRDTLEVLSHLDLKFSQSKLLAIVANIRGALEAAEFKDIAYLGFPLSVSETFQQKNTNKSISEALEELIAIQDICKEHDKELVVYLSMGFGNPYGEHYDESIVLRLLEKLIHREVKIISLADTVGLATPVEIRNLVGNAIKEYKHAEVGVHLHSSPTGAMDKVKAAFEAGCLRFDGALKGFGGCPMAGNELVGNIATENMLDFFEANSSNISVDKTALNQAMNLAQKIF